MSDVFVYVIAIKDGDEIRAPVKIGVSNNPRARLDALQTACPLDLVLVRQFAFPNREMALDFEDAFHGTQAHLRARGEWFEIPPSTAIQIINLHVRCALSMSSLNDEERQAVAEMCGLDPMP